MTVTKNVLIGLALIFVLSCNKNDDVEFIKQENGIVWLSGGLAKCAQQIHLDSGDNLIVSIQDIKSFKSGDRVNVKYKENGLNEHCSPGIDCQIFEIK